MKSFVLDQISSIVQCQQSFDELLKKFDRRVMIDLDDRGMCRS